MGRRPGTSRRNVRAPALAVTTRRSVGSGMTQTSPRCPRASVPKAPRPPSSSPPTLCSATRPRVRTPADSRAVSAPSAATTPAFMSHAPRPTHHVPAADGHDARGERVALPAPGVAGRDDVDVALQHDRRRRGVAVRVVVVVGGYAHHAPGLRARRLRPGVPLAGGQVGEVELPVVDVQPEPAEPVRDPLLGVGLGVGPGDARDAQERPEVADQLPAPGQVVDGVEHGPLGVGQPGGCGGTGELGHGRRLEADHPVMGGPFHHVGGSSAAHVVRSRTKRAGVGGSPRADQPERRPVGWRRAPVAQRQRQAP